MDAARPWWAAPSFPLAVALAIAPAAGVLQSKALAPIAVVALAGCVLAHRRALGGWPWPVDFPRNILAGLALAIFGWAALTAAWAPEPWRALGTALQLGGFVALGIAAARAVAADAVAAQRRLLRLATAGLVGGLALAGLDAASGNAIRAAVRGLETIPPGLAFGLKPAASAMALWLPLVAAAPLPRWLRALILLGGAAVLVALPGEAAKLAVGAALVTGAVALLLPRRTAVTLGAALALAIIAMPLALGPVLTRGVPAAGIPPSAAHRLLIWDFVIHRIDDRPLLGWGMEASRSIPGRSDHPGPAALGRFGLRRRLGEPWLAGDRPAAAAASAQWRAAAPAGARLAGRGAGGAAGGGAGAGLRQCGRRWPCWRPAR